MMREKLLASDFLTKDVLNLETGDLIGEVTGVLVTETPLHVIALVLYNGAFVEAEQRLTFCDYRMVTDVDQQAVVVSACPAYLPSDGKNLMDLSCIDCNGKLIGHVIDCEWQSIDGVISEIIVEQRYERVSVPITAVGKIGSGAVVLNITAEQLQKQEATTNTHYDEDDADETLHHLIRRMSASLSVAGQRVGERVKQIDADEINREVNRFTEKVGKELRNVIETISEQTKTPKNATMESEITSVMRDLENFTVSAPIYDHDGDLIVMPGQRVTEEIVRHVIENGKIAELYRVAVSVKTGEDNE